MTYNRSIFTTALIFLLLNLHAQTSLNEVYQEGMQAYKEGNYELFLEKMIASNNLRSNHPTLLYNLAAAYSLTNQKEESVDVLRKVAWMNSSLAFEEDSDFNNLQNFKPFKQFLEEVDELNSVIENGENAFALEDLSLHPEGVAYSEKQKKFYVGSVRQRKIISIDANGKVQDFASGVHLNAIMGLKVDEKRDLLWVCSTPIPEMEGYEDGKTGQVVSFSLSSGAIVGTYSAPHENAWLGDLVLSSKGAVYASNSNAENPIIYKVVEGQKELDILHVASNLISLQGMALNADESALFIADYRFGILKYELGSEKMIKLESKVDHPLKGIDGLYFHKGNLIAIHNGLRPFRVVKYVMNDTEDVIEEFEFIEKALPQMNEPTLGVIVGNDLYYVINSPWGAYDKEKNLKLEEVSQPTIRKVRIKK